MQSNVALKLEPAARLHVGIIMDGNGRWATRRGLSRLRGHEAGWKPSAAWSRPRRTRASER